MQSHSEVLGISTSPWECVWEGGNNSAPNPDNVVFFGSWPFRMPHLNSGFPDTSESTCTSSGEGIGYPLQYSWASLVAQLVKNTPAMWETWVWSLGWEDPLEKGKTTDSSILAWRIPWITVHGIAKSRTWLSDFHFTTKGENPILFTTVSLEPAILPT